MRAAARAEGLYATDLAEALVRSGVPFREAHRRVGELLRRLETEARTVRTLSPDEWADLGLADGAVLLDGDRAVRARSTPGGPSPEGVRVQAEAIERALSRSAPSTTERTRQPDPLGHPCASSACRREVETPAGHVLSSHCSAKRAVRRVPLFVPPFRVLPDRKRSMLDRWSRCRPPSSGRVA
jgi:hypothetical protein